jgi:NTE family protein
MSQDATSARVALVLAGGAARGAYEVGVVQHILEEVSKDLGRDVPLDILCGTSIGALNACALAAFADEPRGRAARLVDIWSRLRVEELVQPDLRGILSMGTRWLRGTRDAASVPAREGGIVDPEALERLIEAEIPFAAIDGHLQSGRIEAVTVSTTHVASGRTVVFVHRAQRDLPPWSLDPTITPRAAQITSRHAFASAAIPILFRAVRLDGEFHCDGGLRQNVPLSPARRLGARGVIVVNPRFIGAEPAETLPRKEDLFPGPLFLLGKTLNALLLDRIDTDLARLRSINDILEAGTRRYGAGFVDEINEALGHPKGRGMRPMRSILIRTSQDIGKLASEYVRSPIFAKRVGGGAGRLMRRLGEREARDESDLLSYLLFDGEFARQLIEVGREDARARHAELCGFFEAMSNGG